MPTTHNCVELMTKKTWRWESQNLWRLLLADDLAFFCSSSFPLNTDTTVRAKRQVLRYFFLFIHKFQSYPHKQEQRYHSRGLVTFYFSQQNDKRLQALKFSKYIIILVMNSIAMQACSKVGSHVVQRLVVNENLMCRSWVVPPFFHLDFCH